MVKQLICLAMAATSLLLARLAGAKEKPKVEFRDGDRIAFVGNEFFERDADCGYIETELTTRFPDKNLTFRNLGYSGDTVRADARNLCSGWATFGPADQGFDRLKNLIEHIKPTLVFVAYGMNESFDGPKGVEPFVQGLGRMLDMLAAAGAPGVRIVLVSPIRHEDLGRPLPDPTEHNKNIALYIDAMEKIARERGCAFINLFDALGDGTKDAFHTPFTVDGIHLTPYGYWRTAMVLEAALGYPPRTFEVQDLRRQGEVFSFVAAGTMLPLAPPPSDSPRALVDGTSFLPAQGASLQFPALAPGRYVLKVGDQVVAKGAAEQWPKRVALLKGPGVDQEEQLRKTVVAKNFDFFNFWRPDNDTYIFGYRKHEQGRNAVEIPRFEPLVEAKESEIAKLRVPVAHVYELIHEKSE
jgi:lysophospholipase L1-like esterase